MFLKDHLPNYMIPSAFVILDALPLTSEGGVDLATLPEPEGIGDHVAPRDETERQLVQIFKKLLDIPRVGVTDNFFDLGGHSLLTLRLLAEIERAFGKKPPLSAIFHYPTIEELAEKMKDEGGEDEG